MIKNRLIHALIAFMLVISIEGCVNELSGDSKGTITVSILPFSYFTSAIAGPEYDINVIVPPGASPATFEPPPSVIRNLKGSDAVIFNKYLGFEQAWMGKLMAVNDGVKVLYLADNQDIIASDRHRHGDHDHYSGVDPHFWVSTDAAKQIALDIKEFLQGIYPDDKELFEENYKLLIVDINETKDYVSAKLKSVENRTFLIFHPSLSYFAREFMLKQVPIELEGKEPGAAWLKDVIDLARKENINTILVQKEFNKSSAEIIAAEIDGRVLDINPLSEDWPLALREIIDAIVTDSK